MTTLLFLVLIAVFALILVSWLAPSSYEATDTPYPQSTAASLSFLSYLQDLSRYPALIAYRPLGFDPTDSTSHSYPTLDSIRADLQALRSGFDGLMLYGYDSGVTPNIVAEAVDEGYRAILLGIWNPHSEEELDGTVNVVKTYGKDIVFAVCIGNEGISFNRYTLTDLLCAAQRLDRALGFHLPLCTSEPLETYAQPSLRTFGDFLAPHIHPASDRPRLSPEGSAYWTREQALRLAQLAQKPLLVKETGFPHAGKPKYTLASQRRFWKSYRMEPPFVRLSVNPPIWVSYAAVFEAFDQPWRAQQSLLPIEQSCGLLDQARTPSPAFLLWSHSPD